MNLMPQTYVALHLGICSSLSSVFFFESTCNIIPYLFVVLGAESISAYQDTRF